MVARNGWAYARAQGVARTFQRSRREPTATWPESTNNRAKQASHGGAYGRKAVFSFSTACGVPVGFMASGQIGPSVGC